MEEFIIGFIGSLIGCSLLIPTVLLLARMFGVYAIVHEGEAHVYTLFGQVIGVLREPGLYLLPFHLGLKAPIVRLLGECRSVDLRLDQEYLRSQPVNSEEGAPMGVGIWYEMSVTDPVAFIYRNATPRESLATNVRSAVVRCLSNMKLSDLLEDRHAMSQMVRTEVSPHSAEWGYLVGSVYIRKVHFRDAGMIRQIEEKVVNRLRQVTSAILQDGANQVSVIASTAENQAAAEFARAAAMRPKIVGETLHQITGDPEIAAAMFEILETQQILAGQASITMIPGENLLLPQLLAGRPPGE